MAAFFVLLTELVEENPSNDLLYLLNNRRRHSLVSSINTVVAATQITHTSPRIENYVEYVPKYSIDDFKLSFRMNRTSFDQVIAKLNPVLSTRIEIKIRPENQLLIFVKYVSSLLTLQEVADMFGVCESTVHFLVKYVASKICKHNLSLVIKWPKRVQINDIEGAFRQSKRFPEVIGAIDCSHIPIRTPLEYPEIFINRKRFPSVILQAVCDSNFNFIDVYCGFPGSAHDSRVFKRSPLYGDILADPDQMFPGNTHILGDAAYILNTWMLVPFKDYGNLNEQKKRYNYAHSATRMCFERAFGVLKGRFRRLTFIYMLDSHSITNLFLSCCALHQLCLRNMEDIKEYLQEGLISNVEINNDFKEHIPNSRTAEAKRDQIVELLNE